MVNKAMDRGKHKKEKRAKSKTKKTTTHTNSIKKGPPKSYAALVREVSRKKS